MNETVSGIANKWGLGGGFLSILYGWLTSADTAIFIGTTATLVGLVVSVYFQRDRRNREKQAHESNELLKQQEERRKQELHQAQLEYYLNYKHQADHHD